MPVKDTGYRAGRYKKMRHEVKLQGRMLRSQSPVDHGLTEGNVHGGCSLNTCPAEQDCVKWSRAVVAGACVCLR